MVAMTLLEQMKADTLPGKCICCDEALPQASKFCRRPRVKCGHPECELLYHYVAKMDLDMKKRKERT